MRANVHEPELAEDVKELLTDGVVPLPERLLPREAGRLERQEPGGLFERRPGQRHLLDERVHQVVRLRREEDPTRLQHAEHLGEGDARIGHVDEHRLTRHQIERVVLERQRLGAPDAIREVVRTA